MPPNGIFHQDFQDRPLWWDAWEPKAIDLEDVPRRARVAIVGGGYAGLACALELHKHGLDAVVLDAEMPGFGASSRNGGLVLGGVTVGKRFSGTDSRNHLLALYADAADSFTVLENLIAAEKIDCEWKKPGLFVGAWCPKHYRALEKKFELINEGTGAGAYLLPRPRQREEIGSDFYHGGMVVTRSAHLHPALYFKGLLELARGRGIPMCAGAPVIRIVRNGSAWRVETTRGAVAAADIVVCTNGYTGPVTPQLQRRVIPIGSYIIATEKLPPDIAEGLMPRDKSVDDTQRVLTYFRMSGDRTRLIFGGRARFGPYTATQAAPILHRFMTDRFPQLKGVRITHAWTGNVAFTFDEVPHMGKMDGLHYALGCNGSGIAMMTYLGTMTARRIAGQANFRCAFEAPDFPTHPLYRGNPWFVPMLGRYFRIRDWLDRTFDG